MKFVIYEPNSLPVPGEAVVYVQLRPSEDNTEVSLVTWGPGANVGGGAYWYILSLREGKLAMHSTLPDNIGFDLDSEGCIVTDLED